MKATFASFALALGLLLPTGEALAMPAAYVGKSAEARVAHSSQIVSMRNEKATVITFMTDYEGPLEPFALVTAVPADVTTERVVSLKRDFVDHVDKLTAPRFHEYWEMEPCEPGEPEQEWQRSMAASSETAFLGGGGPSGGDGKKAAKELFLNVNVEFKQGEYQFQVLDSETDPVAWLEKEGYKPSKDLGAKLAPYLASGMKTLVAKVDPARVELVGGERAQLSPIQYWSETQIDSLPLRLGLLNAPPKGKQETLLYFIDAENRFEAKNYKTIFPPTNIKVDFIVKEKMGEFYGALHDRILEKHPKSFLSEYAWSMSECGQPCATTPPAIFEILSLGGHVFEQWVPDEEKNPKPPELSPEEVKAKEAEFKALKPKDRARAKKEFEEERKIIAARKKLVERHQYLVSRLHYRFDAEALPEDPRFVAVSRGVKGGLDLPKGPDGAASAEVKEADKNQLQTRYYHLHPSPVEANCENPQRHRWGRAPRTYRGLRKIWVAEDLTRKNRTKLDLDKVILNPLTELGVVGAEQAAAALAASQKEAAAKPEPKACGCRAVGEKQGHGFAYLLSLLAFLPFVRRASRRPTGS